MTIEEKLREYILSHYHSLLEFTESIGMPYGTIQSIFKRGINNSSITNIIKICKALHISADALSDGEIVPVRQTMPDDEAMQIAQIITSLSPSDRKEVIRYAEFIKQKH